MQSGRLRLGAVGDIALCGQIADEMRAHGAGWPFEHMRETLASADVLFGNLECPFLPPGVPPEKIDPRAMYCDVDAAACIEALKTAGFDFLCLANNHVLDVGSQGIDHTRSLLQGHGLAAGGVGYSQHEARQPVVLERNGLSLGFLSYCEDNNYSLGHTNPGPAYYTRESVIEDVARLRTDVDVVVVSIHADIEFMPTPSVPRRETSRAIAKAGAHIIIEHHPHVPQGIEMVDGCLIAYSLGNFVFCSHTSDYMRIHQPHTAHSFVLLMDVDCSGVQGFERVPYDITKPPEQRPTPLSDDARAERMRYLEELDVKLQDDDFVKQTWRQTAMKMLATTLARMPDATPEDVIEELVGRFCLVAENRSWMDEVMAMGREAWERQKQERRTHQRPSYRFTSRPQTNEERRTPTPE